MGGKSVFYFFAALALRCSGDREQPCKMDGCSDASVGGAGAATGGTGGRSAGGSGGKYHHDTGGTGDSGESDSGVVGGSAGTTVPEGGTIRDSGFGGSKVDSSVDGGNGGTGAGGADSGRGGAAVGGGDGRYDAGSALPSTCGAKTIPTCDSAECFEWCAKGSVPCATGCCTGERNAEYRDPTGSTEALLAQSVHSARDGAGAAYFMGSSTEIFVVRLGPPGPDIGAIVDPTFPGPPPGIGLPPAAVNPTYIAVSPNGNHLNLVYGSPAGFRQASGVVGTGWTYETLSFSPTAVRVDDAGRVLILGERGLQFRASGTAFEAPPLELEATAIALDEGGRLCAATATKVICYDGSKWIAFGTNGPENPAVLVFNGAATNMLQSNFTRIDHGGAHTYSFEDGNLPAADLNLPSDTIFSRVTTAMDVDECGTPYFHVRYSAGPIQYSTATAFVRWTSVGWRGDAIAGDGCSASALEAVAISVGRDRVYLGANVCAEFILSYPR
jgi:hypothetical protein